MPRRKTTLSDSSPPAPNQAEETSSDSVRTSERPNKRRKTSVGSASDNGSSDPKSTTDMDKKTRQTRSSGSSQPTSKKASILSRAATSSSPAPHSQAPATQHLLPASQSQLSGPQQQQQPHHPQAPASAGSTTTTPTTTTTDVLVYIRGQQRDQPLAAQLTLTQQIVDHSVLKVSSDKKYPSEATPTTSHGQLVILSSTEQQQQPAEFQQDEQRTQSSSAPPDLVSEPKRESRGGQIRDRRPTRSLEALFKVTDSELQNMREDPPTSTPSPAPVTVTTEQTQSYIVLNDLHLMDSGEATQIIIAPSEITGDAMSDGGYYTISTIPSSSSHEQSAITFSSSNEGSREGGIKLVVHSDKGDYHELTNVTNQTHSYSLISDQAEKGAGAKPPTSTPGRKRIHPQKPGKYKCKYCDRTCAKPSVLEKHLRAHTNERPFPCVVCGVSFKTKSNLSKHCKSNAHMSRTGISWSGSKDNSNTEVKDEEGKQDEEDNDSECTDTDVEGAGYVDNDDESGDENPKVIVESTDGQLQIKPEPPVRQGSVLEGIRQKIDKNKRQQQEQEKEGKLEISKWFTRIFDAFDKPSESELAKYEEARSVVQQNILGMDDMSGAEAILAELQRLKNDLGLKYPGSLPVLMTHNFLPDNKMLVKILRPKEEYLGESSRSGSQPPVKEQQTKNSDVSCSGCVMSISPKIGVPSILGRPPSSNSILQSKLTYKGPVASDVGRDEARGRQQPMSQSSDVPAERLSFDSSTQRPRLVSQRGDNSVGSLRSLYSQSSRNSSLTSVSGEETPSLRLRQFSNEGGESVKTTAPSRHPALGDSNTAAFSTIGSLSDKPVLVYQHALDSESDKMLKFQGRSLSSSVTQDMLKDRIENIISSNAEIIDKHSVSEPPRPRNKYYRQTSDSSFQTMKISDLRPSNEANMDRLTVEPNADKQGKKKLAASLSVGETDGTKLRPDFVKRSMSTSALRKAESSEGELRLLHPQTLMVSTNSFAPTVSAPQYVSVGVVQQESATLHQKLQGSEPPLVNKCSQEQLNDRVGSAPGQIVGKSLLIDGQVTTVTHISMLNSGPTDSVNMNNPSPFSAAHVDGLKKARLVCIPFPQLTKQSNVCDFKEGDVGTRKPSSPHGSVHKNQDAKSGTPLTSEASKSFSVSSPSLISGSPSGGRVTIQESQSNAKLTPGTSLVHPAVPPSLPTKIVQGPGPHEIQIQIQLSKNANHQPVAHIQQSGAGGSSATTTTGVPKSSSESSSIISSMLQAPRQLSPMIGQPGVQFPALSKAGSPLLTSRSFSGFTTGTRIPVSSLVQTGSLDQDSLAAGKIKIGSTTYTLHDQKKPMIRQGPVTLSVPQQTKQPASFMTELQQRLAVPRCDSPTAVDWKKRDLAGLVGGVDSDKLAEHFKSQGLSDGLAAAAGAYLMNGPFTCEDCGETFNQMGLLNQHKAQQCPKNKGLRRSLSAMETTAGQNPAKLSGQSPHPGGLLIKAGSQPLKKSNPALFKSLSTTDLHTEHQSNVNDLPKLREQLVLVSSSSSPSPTVTSIASLSPNPESMDTSSNISQQISQRQSLIIENNNPSLRRKKGRPKGSKNRPKDLNLVLAKARGAHCQTLLPGVRQGSIGQTALDGSYQKDSPLPGLSGTGQVLFLQSGQFPKILLPRSAPATQASSASTDMAPASTMAAGGQVMSTASTTMNTISIGGTGMIGQPMVLPGSKMIRQNSNMGQVASSTKANIITASGKSNIGQGVPILGLSPGVSISGLALNCTSSVSVLTPGTPITALTPGTPLGALTPGTSKSGSFMIFPVSTLTPATPGTPMTPVTPTNPINCKTARAQSLESSAYTTGPSKLASGTGLTLNISSAQSAGSSQFSQMSPRVIPYIPAVTFHNVDPTPKLTGSNLTISSPLPDPRSQQFKISQNPSMTLSLAGPSTPGTPLTPATPDTPTDLSGTRRKLKDKLLLRQSLSVERGHDKASSMDSPHPGFMLKPFTESPAVLPSPPPLLFFPPATKPSTPATTSVLLASLTKPIMSSLKLGSQPNAVITTAVMGKPKETEKPPDTFYRSESETHASSETAKIHSPVMRAFSEPAAAKRLKKSKQMKPSPLSIEEKPPNGGVISKMLSSSRLGSHSGQDDPTSKKSWCLQTKVESGSDSFDSGLSLRSMSQETPFFFPKSGSIASLDSNELMIDLSGDNFNNVTIPINYSIPFVNVSRLQSGPLLTEWNHSSRLTGSQVNLSPLTLVGSKIILPAVGGTALIAREAKNWQLKRSISLHRHFQILSRLWQSSSPVTLDSMTAMALAQGNPSPALLGRMLLSYSSSGSSFSETPSTGTPGSADPAKLKVPPSYPVAHESIDLTKDDPQRQLQASSSIGETTDHQNSEIKSPAPLATPANPDKSLHTTSTSQLKARLMASISSPVKNSLDSASSEDHQHFHSRQVSTPIKSSGLSFPSASSLLSSVEQHLSNVTPTGTLNTPMYGHSCPTLYTTTHVTFCCIQRPQPMYVAVKGSKKISMYSNWRLATHNPNPVGLTSRMLLSLYKSRNASNPVFAQCSMTPSNGGNQTHSSYWTYQRKKMGIVKKELLAPVKSEDIKPSVKLELGSSKEGKRHKLRLSKGGFKSNEKYEYIRGRGWGKYICELCGIRCKKPSMLKKHLRTHTDLRPYHCRHCHFSFKTKGNLTKHMKSKSHQKKCFELGIIPVPTSVDDSQIDSEALEEQCRISREARIHDSGDGQNPSGDEDDDDDMEGDDDDDDDEDDEDEGMSREDAEDQSFDQERSGSSSPRVLKRQSSVDEASPVFSFGQRSRPTWSQSKSRNREFSESSNISYSSQSSMENRAMSPHNIDTEIARSLLDLSQPRRSESKEIVDEEARRHALSHLQSLITQLMAQKKPLSGLNITGDSTSTAPESGRMMMTPSLGSAGDGRSPKTPSTSDAQSQSQQWFSQDEGLLSRYGRKNDPQHSPQRSTRSLSDDVSGPSGKSQAMKELYVATEDKGAKGTSSDKSGFYSRVKDPSGRISPVSAAANSPSQSTSSPSVPARPNQLSLLKSPMSPSKLHHSNLPSPSLMSFLPAYMSSHYAQRARVSKTADQGPIIGQFVRKDSHSVNTPNVALTPNLVLAGQSQPFHFNIPFPGAGLGSVSDYDGHSIMSPVVNAGRDFMHNIPIVTVTDTSCESPTIESTADQCSNTGEVKENLTELTGMASSSAAVQETTSTFTPSVNQTSVGSSGDLNKTTSTMSSSALTSVSSLSSVKVSTVVKSSTKHTLESQGRSNSESATMSPKRRDSAIESLIRESAMPILLVTGTKYSNKNSCEASDPAHVSSPSPNSQSDSCIDGVAYPVAKRSCRLSSGKSRFLRRQRSLADDTAFPSADQDSVFDNSKVSAEFSLQKAADHSGDNIDPGERRNLELVKRKSFQELSTVEQHVSQDGDAGAVVSGSRDGDGRLGGGKDEAFESVLDKTKDSLKPKLNSCVFCSENFDSVEAYNGHLKSRKHIGVLESLGMLPAGTYEKLQQSELHDSRAEEGEEQKVELKMDLDDGNNGFDGSGGSGGGIVTVEAVVNVGDDPGVSRFEDQSLEPEQVVCDIRKGEERVGRDVPRENFVDKGDITQGHLVTVPRNEFGTLRRAVSLQEDTMGFTGNPSTPGQAKLHRPAYKRKISQQSPVTESATVLTKPHLNESLRLSLVKRARHGLTTVKEAETGFKGQLVIDEESPGGRTLVTSSPPTSISQSLSTMVSLLTSAPLAMTPSAAPVSSVVVSNSAASGTPGNGSVTGGKTNAATWSSGMDIPDRAEEYPTSHQVSLTAGVPPPGLSAVNSVTAPQGVAAVSPIVSSGITTLGPSSVSNLATSGAGYLVPSSVPPGGPGTLTGLVVGSPLMSSSSVTVLGSSAMPPARMTSGIVESSSTFSSKMVDGAMHYQCGLCDLNFTNMIQLKSHLVSHTELRPYVCQFCDAGFTNSQSLRTHLLTHGQDRPYICGNCGDTFAQQADLQVHYSSHSSTSIRQHQNVQSDVKIQTTIQSLTAQYGVPRQDRSSPINQSFVSDTGKCLNTTGINNPARLELNTSPGPVSNSPSPVSVVSYSGPATASACSSLHTQQESSLGLKTQPPRASLPVRQLVYSPKLEIIERNEGTSIVGQPKEDSLKQGSDLPEELVAKLENMCASPASSGQLRVDLTDQSFSEDELTAGDNGKGQAVYPQQWSQQQQQHPGCPQQPQLSSPSGYHVQHCYHPAQQQQQQLYIQQLQSPLQQQQQLYPQEHQAHHQQPFLQHQHFQMSSGTQHQTTNNNNIGHDEQSCENEPINSSMLSGSLSNIGAYSLIMDAHHCPPNWDQNLTNVSHSNLIQAGTVQDYQSHVRMEDTPLQGGSYSSELAAHDGPYHGEDNSGDRHESMECQGSYRSRNNLGGSEAEQGQQHNEGASDPHLLPQTYYGLS